MGPTRHPSTSPGSPTETQDGEAQGSSAFEARAAAYLLEPFRCICRTCGESEVRENREAALEFARSHEAGNVVLSPAANLAATQPVMADGGQREFFVLDEATATVTDGPFLDEDDAKAAVDRPGEIVATRSVLEMIALTSSTTLRWSNEDGPDVVTDGGRDEGECRRCSTTTSQTDLTGEFQCERCARSVAKTNRNRSREEGQGALEDFRGP